MLAAVASIHVSNTTADEDVDGRDKPDHDDKGSRRLAFQPV